MTGIMSACIVALCVTAVACSGREQRNAEEITRNGDTVTISTTSPILGKITCDTVATEPFTTEFRSYGSVQAENGRYADICLPFDGRIIRSCVRIGQKVEKGQTLFEMSSPEYLATSKEYFQSLQTYHKAKTSFDRKKALSETGIISKKELDEAFAEAENARVDKEYLEATLRVYGTDPSVMKMGQPMKVLAPISGEVAANRVTAGSFLKAEGEPMVTITDLRRVWIPVQVKERFIGKVALGGHAEVFTEADPDTIYKGEIMNVGNIVDEQTRSIEVIVSCDNSDFALKHGMYVAVRFVEQTPDMVVVPSTALFQGEHSSYVYACTDAGNVFVRRQVTVGQMNRDNTVASILGGISKGERIITEGGLYLNH